MKNRAIITLLLLFVFSTPSFCTINILWDTTHGCVPGYTPSSISGNYQELVILLESNDMNLDRLSTGLSASTLAGYNAAVIAAPCVYNSSYTPEEITALQNFVSAGGGLLILGDYIYSNYNDLAQSFGFSFGPGTLPDYEIVTSAFNTHPIVENVTDIYMLYAAEMTLAENSDALVYDAHGNPVVAENLIGNGRVIAMSDSSLWLNLNPDAEIDQADNRQFALNVFEYLGTVPEPATCMLMGFGAFFLSRRQRR